MNCIHKWPLQFLMYDGFDAGAPGCLILEPPAFDCCILEPIFEAIIERWTDDCGRVLWFWKARSNLIFSMFCWFSISFLTFW